MGKMKQHPRYNVLSFRATDEELAEIRLATGKRTRQSILLEAVLNHVRALRQAEFDRHLNAQLDS